MSYQQVDETSTGSRCPLRLGRASYFALKKSGRVEG
jgi:uncharacterized protein (DUF427 family)